MISGVCGGVADYLNMDPTLVRILTVVISLFTGIPIILYIVALFVVPEEPANEPTGYPPVAPTPPSSDVWGSAGAPWQQSTPSAAPSWTPTAEPGPAPQASSSGSWTPAAPEASTPAPEPSAPAPEPVAPSDPAPVEPTDPEPVAPSDPEAPVVPPSEGDQPKS